ncbi:MAG TPA: argininosuccinate lyase, partial [Ktedonobacteraceae bacterium]|nr:argininosuccinate lyase [Ktedonobacteraceae bacterium]
MSKLWQKGYSVYQQVESYEAAQNSILDTRLIRHDVWGSLAHVAMLHHIGVLSSEEHQAIKQALCTILEQEAAHQF